MPALWPEMLYQRHFWSSILHSFWKNLVMPFLMMWSTATEGSLQNKHWLKTLANFTACSTFGIAVQWKKSRFHFLFILMCDVLLLETRLPHKVVITLHINVLKWKRWKRKKIKKFVTGNFFNVGFWKVFLSFKQNFARNFDLLKIFLKNSEHWQNVLIVSRFIQILIQISLAQANICQSNFWIKFIENSKIRTQHLRCCFHNFKVCWSQKLIKSLHDYAFSIHFLLTSISLHDCISSHQFPTFLCLSTVNWKWSNRITELCFALESYFFSSFFYILSSSREAVNNFNIAKNTF